MKREFRSSQLIENSLKFKRIIKIMEIMKNHRSDNSWRPKGIERL